jgi:hypothetical protein
VSERDIARPAVLKPSDVDADPALAPRDPALVPRDPALVPRDPALVPRQRRRVDDAAPTKMSRLALATVVLVVALAVTWILVSWRMLHSPLVDAVGEAAGTVFLALLVVSVVGAVRRSRRR